MPHKTALAADSHHRDLWVIVLAGGEGVRLRPLISRLYGDSRPKQYAALLDQDTLLRHTLDRAQLLAPPERTVVVTMQSHLRYTAGELRPSRRPHLLPQPRDLGTAAGVLLPAHWIAARDPEASVAVLPSDHYFSDEPAFREHVAEIAGFVEEHPEWIVLLGADPRDPETEYGWIEPGERLGWAGRGPLYTIRRFVEKPTEDAAMALLAAGCLWNTFVLVATAATLIGSGRTCIPRLHDRLARIGAFAGTAEEPWAIRQAYALAPRANFSRSVLETCPAPLAVARLSDVTWCDLGTPDRVARVMARLQIPSGA
jgi:mannose-1-phosphate guanylyltransferase